jgi:hypothetical protein
VQHEEMQYPGKHGYDRSTMMVKIDRKNDKKANKVSWIYSCAARLDKGDRVQVAWGNNDLGDKKSAQHIKQIYANPTDGCQSSKKCWYGIGRKHLCRHMVNKYHKHGYSANSVEVLYSG